jgi:hypothetical protein
VTIFSCITVFEHLSFKEQKLKGVRKITVFQKHLCFSKEKKRKGVGKLPYEARKGFGDCHGSVESMCWNMVIHGSSDC